MLVRLIYTSRATGPVDAQLLQQILNVSQESNHRRGITGVLCAHAASRSFLQVLEGSRTNVAQLYEKLIHDDRHTEVMLVSFKEIRERRFPSWQMGGVDLEKVNRSTLLRYSEHNDFDPFLLNGATAESLLEALADRASVVSGEGGRRAGAA